MVAPVSFQVYYAKPFHLLMLTLGVVGTVLALNMLVESLTDPAAVPEATEESRQFVWFACVAIGGVMGYYAWRALRRLTDKRPFMHVDDKGLTVRIDGERHFPWEQIMRVTLGSHKMRARLEVTLQPEVYATLRLPGMLSDDNVTAVRRKPYTIGIAGQGLDQSPKVMYEAVRRFRPDIVLA